MTVLFIILGIILIIVLFITIGTSIRRPGQALDETEKPIVYSYDSQKIPHELLQDSLDVAADMFPTNKKEAEDFAISAIGMVVACKDKDVLLLFNSGGYGRAHYNASLGWDKMLFGIEDILHENGNATVTMSYNRATRFWSGFCNEQAAWFSKNKKQIEEEAAKLFLCLRHNPRLRIILCGESNGSHTSYQVFKLLEGTGRVYAILTGPPPWRKMDKYEQIYLTRTNGEEPDTFSQGKVGAILGRNIKVIFRKDDAVDGGKILNSIGAPGHLYGWEEYPKMREEISQFLCKYFEAQNK